MKLSKALFLSATLVNACSAERSLEADVHSCACEAIEFEFEINCEDIDTVSDERRRHRQDGDDLISEYDTMHDYNNA